MGMFIRGICGGCGRLLGKRCAAATRWCAWTAAALREMHYMATLEITFKD
jgi:hypothetical protein